MLALNVNQSAVGLCQVSLMSLKERLNAALKHVQKSHPERNQAGVAKATGASTAAVAKWFTGETKSIRSKYVRAASRYLQVDSEWLSDGIGPMRIAEIPSYHNLGVGNIGDVTDEITDREEQIMQWESTVGATSGSGQVNDDEYVKGRLSFKTSWLKRHGYEASQLRTVYVRGNSMAPRILDGDTVVVNMNYGTLRNEKTYAFSIDDEAFIKKLIKNPDGTITLVSTNKTESPDRTLTLFELEQLNIVGQVVHISGRID